MRYFTDSWDYELLDTSAGERLERWGDIILIRPDPQVIWQSEKKHPLWKKAHARYHRSNTGGGNWEYYRPIPESWSVSRGDLTFQIKPMNFKHTGLFPEQAVNWDLLRAMTEQAKEREGRTLKVLNLFAYTGAATVAGLKSGAAVTHVDASKGMVAWAKENAAASGVAGGSVRWLVDDCLKFVQREQRRGNRYDGILLDPPSYGRGPGGEVWQLEEALYGFLLECAKLLDRDSSFVILNSYTTGLSPSVMEYLLKVILVPRLGGTVTSDEIGIPVSHTDFVLPCGATCIWRADQETHKEASK